MKQINNLKDIKDGITKKYDVLQYLSYTNERVTKVTSRLFWILNRRIKSGETLLLEDFLKITRRELAFQYGAGEKIITYFEELKEKMKTLLVKEKVYYTSGIQEIILPEQQKILDFQKELASLINKFSFENLSNTPDFVLAEYLYSCLENFNKTIKSKENVK